MIIDALVLSVQIPHLPGNQVSRDLSTPTSARRERHGFMVQYRYVRDIEAEKIRKLYRLHRRGTLSHTSKTDASRRYDSITAYSVALNLSRGVSKCGYLRQPHAVPHGWDI